MAYAYVQDVAESWENYERLSAALGDGVPEGLIVHVAGPTDTGFRIIDVWESRKAWEHFRKARLRPAARSVAGDEPVAKPEFRSLRVLHILRARPGVPLERSSDVIPAEPNPKENTCATLQ